MEYMFKKMLPFALLLSAGVASADDCCKSSCSNDCGDTMSTVTNCYLPRSQSRNIVIKTAGLDPDHEHLFDMDNIYGTINIAVQYEQSFSNDKIAKCLFGPAVNNSLNNSVSSTNSICSTSCSSDCDDSVTIRIVGLGATPGPNGTSDLVADLFFLPDNFLSTVTFKPKISNVNVPIQLYLGLDEWCSGLYLRLYGPIAYTRWTLDAKENILNAGTVGYNAGEAEPLAVPASSLYQSFLSYTSGDGITLPTATGITKVQVDSLAVQRINSGCHAATKTGLADLRAELGWDFLLDEDYHLGINIQAAAPTGNDCQDSCLLFAPIVGNGKHWELGGGITGHYTLWRSEDEEQEFGFYVDADITHLFKKSEKRVFDLVNKPLSRYIFAQKVGPAAAGLIVGTGTPNFQFANEWAPVANFAQQWVDVSFDVQGDVAAKFVYTCRGFGWELGYNFWGRSCEKMSLSCDDCNTTAFAEDTWALAGCGQVYGFEATNAVTPGVAGTAVAINVTESATTVFACGGADNLQTPVTFGTFTNNDLQRTSGTASGGPGNISGSNPGIAIKATDFDMESGKTRGISHKIFTHFNYTWIECENVIPYIGFGASAEFGSSKGRGNNTSTSSSATTSNCGNNDCGGCSNCAVSQWSVWFKGGVSFN